MEIKGYVWGGSLHGQVTVQDSFEFVCRRIADLPLARFPEPYPRWKRFICRLIGAHSSVSENPPFRFVDLSTAWNPGTN
jgi:hypothetical protein